jgi:hypothetical protein
MKIAFFEFARRGIEEEFLKIWPSTFATFSAPFSGSTPASTLGGEGA